MTLLQTSTTSTLPADPLEIARRWPVDQPLMMLRSAPSDAPWSRRSIIASPQSILTIREHDSQWTGKQPPFNQPKHHSGAPLDILQNAINATAQTPGLWIGNLSYDLGRVLEPKAAATATEQITIDDRHWPLIEFAWCPNALIHDNTTNTWTPLGDGDKILQSLAPAPCGVAPPPQIHNLQHSFTKSQYQAAVQTIINAIANGDIFQANLTQRLTAEFSGSSRALAIDALQRSSAWFGAYMELPDGRTICSLSPELFLHYDNASKKVTTRPIKGTRPRSAAIEELLHSEKDAAELTMIIDLMRNDLGRVCNFGSVCVPTPRIIESHAGVHHGVGEVVGTLRNDCTITDLLRATIPAGSITGAPKIRAMQIIDDIEPTKRGPYCGAIGVIHPNNDLCLNVAIRTITMTGRRANNRMDVYEHALLDYGAGGGIVADSSPPAEYQEMLDKTAVLRDVLNAVAH